MARNEPFSFGKPLAILVLIGVGFGGYHLYKTWPTSYDGPGWSVNFPPRWTVGPQDGRVVGKGPLGDKKPTGDFTEGHASVTLTEHATVSWPDMPLKTFVCVPETQQDYEIDYKKGMIVTYTDGDYKYMGVVVDRVDVFVTVVIGCKKEEFEKHRKQFDKVVRSVRCTR